MFRTFRNARAVLFVFACGFLAACSQTSSGVSTFSGDLSADQKQAKIKASRKRAARIKAKKKAAFIAKREEGRKKRRAKFSKSRKSKTTITTKRGSKKLRRVAKRRSSKNGKVRSIKGTTYAYVAGRSRGIQKRNRPWRCVPSRLKLVLRQVSKKFGRVVINSTHRSKRHNRLVGGKRRSYHLRCQAVDFRVHGRTRGLTRWLARHPYVGGYNRYPSGYYHIDTGPKRTW